MAPPVASHKALPDGFADKLERLAVRVLETRTMVYGAEIAEATLAIANELRDMALFPRS